MNVNERESETADDSAPFNFGALEINKQRRFKSGCLEVIQALREMFFREPIHTLELDNELILHHQVRKVLSHAEALGQHGIGHLPPNGKSARGQLANHGTLINLLKKPAAQRIRNLVGSPDRSLNQFTFIHVH